MYSKKNSLSLMGQILGQIIDRCLHSQTQCVTKVWFHNFHEPNVPE